MTCVTDTRSLVWYFTEDARLSKNVREAIIEEWRGANKETIAEAVKC